MRNLCNIHCKLLDDIDLFGKEPELYFKGNAKRTSWVGRIFTVFYAMIYMAFFLYKLVRMIQNKDVDFYQTTTFTGETPSIHLDNEAFYGGFALGNVNTLKTFIDERIYFPTAIYKIGHKHGNDWDWEEKDVELEICKIEKFGKKYRDIFKTKIANLYCFKNMDYMMQGHTTYDVYSYFEIKFFPCVNTTENNNKCRPLEEIKNALSLSLVTVKIQDIELTPENYNSPTEVRGKELASPAYLDLYQNIQAYFHIVHVETDIDFIGFELFKNIQTKTFFKYDGTFILPSIMTYPLLSFPGIPYCQISIQLTEQILTLKRTNTKLTEVLGEVGGLMEVVFSLFRIISSFLTDNLYEQALVNNLFSFDLDKKTVNIKQKKTIKNNMPHEEEIKIYSTLKLSSKPTPKAVNMLDEGEINTKNKLSDECLNKNPQVNQYKHIVRRKRKKIKTKSSISSNFTRLVRKDTNNKDIHENNNEQNQNQLHVLDDKTFNMSNSNEKQISNEKEKEINMDNTRQKRNIIEKVKISKWQICCCFLCARKFNNLQNLLLNEGMKIIMEKMDILFMFKKIYRDEKMQENYTFKDEEITMSNECQQKLFNFHSENFK